MHSDIIPISYELSKPFEVHISNRNDARRTVRRTQESVWYTNGSRKHTMAGVEIYNKNTGTTFSLNEVHQ